jgi:dTDP-4-amino-4,6-dideoxygalactose transaminase
MRYYFPSIITSLKLSSSALPYSFHTANSGENAIRLLLRSYRLQPGAKVALPIYVCDSLKQAVYKEGFEPQYLDLKTDRTFWADYNTELLSKEKIEAILLVHLYGFLHPDTNTVMEFCKTNRVFLIHDAAQSFGINEDELKYGSGLVYSFGPGKSSTAAGGAVVRGLSGEFYHANCKQGSNVFVRKARAQLFLKSRIYGYQLSLRDKLLSKILCRVKIKPTISKMTDFQVAAAATVLQLVRRKEEDRKNRYRILERAVKANALLGVPYDDGRGLYFKLVLVVGKCASEFKEYLKMNDVPFFSLKDALLLDGEKEKQFPVFCEIAQNFIELSAEASIPIEEIERVASVLRKYR